MAAIAAIIAREGGVEMVAAAAIHLKRMAAFAPFASCPPVPAALVAAFSVLPGGSETTAYWAVAVAAWLAGAWAAMALARGAARSMRWLAAAVLLFGPPQVWMLLVVPDLPRLLFWTATTALIATLFTAHKSSAANVVWAATFILLAAGSHPPSVNNIDIIAAMELVVLTVVCRRGGNAIRCVAIAAAVASLIAVFWRHSVLPYRRYEPGPPPSDFQSWLAENGAERRVFENQASLDLIEQPGLALAAETIQSPWAGDESLLWLRAFAAEYVSSADWPKYHSRLDPVFESGEWFVYRLPAPNPAEAVLVSFPVWTKLPEIRGIRDNEALAAYLEWSGRPEQVGIVWNNPREATITASLGEFDAILVRRAAAPGWRASLIDANRNETAFPVGSDPLGYMVLAPRIEGPVTIRLRYQPSLGERLWPSRPHTRELQIGAFPSISPNGIVDAADGTPPPFPPGAIVSIYGHGFVDGSTRVIFGAETVIPLYTGPNQINVRLPETLAPGNLQVSVEVAGATSTPVEIEVAAP